MKSVTPYLFFNGNCKAAMLFYQEALGGDLSLFRVGDADPKMFGDENHELILHAKLKNPHLEILASDNMREDTDFGDQVCLYIDCNSREEVDEIYAHLAKDGQADLSPQDHFWGAYMGSLTDAFGISWMVNFQITE